jgi:hypothetical protein
MDLSPTPNSDGELNLVDELYVTKMTAFEVDCNDGKGEAMACHHVGEFLSLVRDDRKRAAAGTLYTYLNIYMYIRIYTCLYIHI